MMLNVEWNTVSIRRRQWEINVELRLGTYLWIQHVRQARTGSLECNSSYEKDGQDHVGEQRSKVHDLWQA